MEQPDYDSMTPEELEGYAIAKELEARDLRREAEQRRKAAAKVVEL